MLKMISQNLSRIKRDEQGKYYFYVFDFIFLALGRRQSNLTKLYYSKLN